MVCIENERTNCLNLSLETRERRRFIRNIVGYEGGKVRLKVSGVCCVKMAILIDVAAP